MPEISVLLPVRDAAPWLAASLRSLTRQSFGDFEIVAVDDGSRDRSGKILEQFAARDPRLRVFRTAPRGLPLALNAALGQSRGRLIARHDADDLSHRRRFERQRARLAARPEVAVVGSRVRLFPPAAAGVGMRRWIQWHNRLLTHEAMAAEVLLDSPLVHGTAMLRRSWLEQVGGWAERGWPEDLDLWVRLLEAGARFDKLPETLYGWRQHPGSATRRDPRYAVARFVELKCDALARGLLRGARIAHLAGTGSSLARWRAALATAGYTVVSHSHRRPSAAAVAEFARPLLLVFVSAQSRARWREALAGSDMREMDDFMFVS